MSSLFTLTEVSIPADWLQATPPTCGALVSFDGVVRNHHEGRGVDHLVYESYARLAVKEGERIVQEAIERFGVEKAAAIHRTGRLEVGEVAVRVAAWGRHRGETFDACRYLIDQIKARVPIWKLEIYLDQSREWVYCPTCAGEGEQGNHHLHG